jgi:nitrite reductase/ring-hydroxylating ferredoxin subunit
VLEGGVFYLLLDLGSFHIEAQSEFFVSSFFVEVIFVHFICITTMAFTVKIGLKAGFIIGVLCIQHYGNYNVLYFAITIFAVYSMYETFINDVLMKYCLLFVPPGTPPRTIHDVRRTLTYPDLLVNTWYHLCDSSEVTPGKVLEVRALNQVFAVWRTDEGKVVVQDAFCLHLGANLAVGGKVEDNCIMCPFHKWKFSEDGTIKEIPYLDDPHKCPTHKKLKTYVSEEWCGMVCVYFHADSDQEPEFPLPKFIPEELKRDDYMPHLEWNLGFVTLNPVDWVDQAGDHAHFNQLHGDFLFPWTTVPIPKWLFSLIPIGITHQLQTHIGDDKDWIEEVKKTGWGTVCKQMIYFTDYVGLTWRGKKMENSMSQTIETFIGPALMCFHIPFTIGKIVTFILFHLLQLIVCFQALLRFSYLPPLWREDLSCVLRHGLMVASREVGG